MKKKTPFQVYLDSRDQALLDRLAKDTGLSRAETVREAIRRWAVDVAGEDDPLLALIGGLDDAEVPVDLSTRHDVYAVEDTPHRRRVAERKRSRSKPGKA
jgi:Ribbon-helix-helix protein, copG family